MRNIIAYTVALGSVLMATSTAWAYETEIYAVSDIAQRDYTDRAQATANLITGSFSRILTMGDANNQTGTYSEYLELFDPGWGRHWPWIWPVRGNHDYMTTNAQGYQDYMGGSYKYYDFYQGSWHFIALDSTCANEANCKDAQLAWLQSVVAEDAAHQCTLAYFHHPRFSSGQHGNNAHMQAIWEALYWGGADLVLSGHDHDYERFKPMDQNGNYGSTGMYQFVVGTGGAQLRNFGTTKPNSDKRIAQKNGVLWLGLNATNFDFKFKQTDGVVGDSSSSPIGCFY